MFWKLSEPKPNGPLVAKLFLDILDVQLSYTTLQLEVEDHPDYPSLLSIGDVFAKYNIENITASFETDQLRHVPPPYITQLKGDNNSIDYFTVVSEVAGETVKFFDPEERKWTWAQFDELAKKSSGIVLFAEAKPNAGESDYKLKLSQEKTEQYGLVALITMMAGIFCFALGKSLIQQGWKALFPALFFCASLTGAFVGFLLLWYELDRYNPIIRQICGANKRTNCNAILQSNAAKIGGVSWSVIGMSYFIGTLVSMLLQGVSGEGALAVTGWLSALAVPFVFFSVYYQWKVVKQWCTLCLSVQGILVMQAFIALWGGWVQRYSSTALVLENILQAITSYAIPFLILLLCLPILKKAKSTKRYKRDLNRLKYDPAVFNALLHKQKNIHESSAGIGIMLGNPNATNKILKVCNPYCGPCAQAHIPIDELLHSNPDIQLQIIFTASADESDYKRLPVRHLLSIAANGDESALMKALDDWYLAKEKSYEPFASKHPMQEDPSLHDHKLIAMQKWCVEHGISHTPTFFINNHELPEMYSVHDLKNFFIA